MPDFVIPKPFFVVGSGSGTHGAFTKEGLVGKALSLEPIPSRNGDPVPGDRAADALLGPNRAAASLSHQGRGAIEVKQNEGLFQGSALRGPCQEAPPDHFGTFFTLYCLGILLAWLLLFRGVDNDKLFPWQILPGNHDKAMIGVLQSKLASHVRILCKRA